MQYMDPTGHDYTCTEGVGCDGDIPDITATCDEQGCRLDPALHDLIEFYAQQFMLPYELLYLTLLTEALDDVGQADPWLDAVVVGVASGVASDNLFVKLASALGWGSLELGYGVHNSAEAILSGVEPDAGIGPGVHMIHTGPAEDAYDYVLSTWGVFQMGDILMSHSSGHDAIARDLATTNGNVMYAAAILRKLTDERLAPSPDPHALIGGALSVNDQAIIYGAYRAGIQSYGDVYLYRAWKTPGQYGQAYLKSYSLYHQYLNYPNYR